MMEKANNKMEADGMSFLKVIIGRPSSILRSGNELQCTLSQTLILKVPGGLFHSISTLVAVSNDEGLNWVFMDVSGKSRDIIKQAIPLLSKELVIPEAKKPIFYKD